MLGMARKPRPVCLVNLGVAVEEFGDHSGVDTVLAHPQWQGFEADIGEPAIECTRYCAAHEAQLLPGPVLHVFCISADHCTTDYCSMPVDEFRRAVNDDIGAECQGLL